uniref:Uncharacterized protein n=1 Tax=Rhizophora mucronata TaxID=61149 RepID=A0A2P2IZU0_RHIMU
MECLQLLVYGRRRPRSCFWVLIMPGKPLFFTC